MFRREESSHHDTTKSVYRFMLRIGLIMTWLFKPKHVAMLIDRRVH